LTSLTPLSSLKKRSGREGGEKKKGEGGAGVFNPGLGLNLALISREGRKKRRKENGVIPHPVI